MKPKRRVAVLSTWHLGTSHRLLDGIYEYIEENRDIQLQFAHKGMVSDAVKWDTDGMIAPIYEDAVEKATSAVFPVVSTCGSPRQPLPFVDVDPEACGAMAADHFLGMGHTQFMTVCRPMSVCHRLRAEGFVKRVEAQGIRSVGEHILKMDERSTPEEDEKIVEWLGSLDKPLALFCSDDNTAGQIISLAEQAGCSLPEEISVMGCEDEYMVCEHVHPTLSSIHVPYKRIGYEAMRLLDQLMKGKEPANTQLFLAPEQVTVRMSTNILATPDVRLRKAFSYIHKNFAEKITIGQIAEEAGVSVRDLQRRFKAALGRSPLQELHLVRIKRVKELLRKTQLTLSEIAERTGFESEYWMGSLFKNITGSSPGTYRKKHRLR